MTRTRWKLMAGVLGLALSGLAVVAGVPSRNGCQRQCEPGAQVAAAPVPGSVAVAVARVNPQQPPIELPPPAAQAPVIPVPAPGVPLELPKPVETPAPAKVTTPGEFPVIPAAATEKAKDAPKPESKPTPVTLPEITPIIPAIAPTSGATIPPQPTLPAPETKPVVPQPVQPTPTLPAIEPQPAPRIEPTALTPQPQPRAETPPAFEPTGAEKKLKVILHMGDERPRFEVRDGDEVYLKVVCERVEVKSPSDRGETMSTLKAAGRVAFVTPGGEGTCDELTVVPGTGQVLVTGKVSFKYNWGKVETTVSGDRMVFRLGTAPSMPQPTTIPASHQRMR
jgi:hypothetical protein